MAFRGSNTSFADTILRGVGVSDNLPLSHVPVVSLHGFGGRGLTVGESLKRTGASKVKSGQYKYHINVDEIGIAVRRTSLLW